MPTFNEQTGTNNPFNGINVGRYSKPTLADLDDDGILDAVVGELDGFLNYYQNTGSASNPAYEEQTGTNNPFNGVDVGSYSAPTLADLDNDGDPDAVVGEAFRNLNYYQNTGSASNPAYEEQTGTNNPFNGINVSISAPTFADLDGDGDLDAVVGERFGTLKYYQNTGSATNPVYREETGSNNPFNGVDVGYGSTPTFADLDNDDDLDAVVGEQDGNLNYYQNTGSATNPVYREETGSNNPFNGITVGFGSAPTFADLDNDGDPDAVVGELEGNLNYFLNAPPTVSLSPANLNQNEGNSGTTAYTYTVTLSNASTETVTVNYSTNNDTATLTDGDYADNDGSLTFAAGETSKEITVNINGDTQFESDETFTLNLNSATNATINPNNDSSSGTILNDDAPPNSPPDAINDTATTNEDNSVNINVLANDTDADGNSLTLSSFTNPTNGTVTRNNNGTPDDLTDDSLTYTPNANYNGTNNFTYTISDGQGGTDTAQVEVNVNPISDISISNVAVNEGDVGTTLASFTVTLDDPSNQAVTVDYATADGSGNNAATDPIDYTAKSDTLTFAPGDTSQTITIAINGDLIDEADETFNVNLSNPTNATITDAQGIGTITDDDITNTQTGTNANETFVATRDTDNINAAGGNDKVIANLSQLQQLDTIDGGVGRDTFVLNAGTSTDTITINVNTTTNQLQGIAGFGVLQNFEVFDLTNFNGSTNFTGTSIGDNFRGGAGADTVTGNDGNDFFSGGAGNDSINGGAGDDTIDGGAGNDTLIGGAGNDIYFVNSSNDTIIEDSSAGVDSVRASASYTLSANIGNLTLLSNSAINGTGNNDNNTIVGNNANNILNGSAGIDTLLGNGGNDQLVGGSGADILTGGAGKDRFVFNSRTEGKDSITDFKVVDDIIDVSKAGFGGGLTAGAATTADQFIIGSAAADREDRFIYNKATGALFFDVDGKGGTAQVQLAQLSSGLNMTNSDIFVIG